MSGFCKSGHKLGDTLKAKNYLYNAIQIVINVTAKNDNTAVILKIFLGLNHSLNLVIKVVRLRLLSTTLLNLVSVRLLKIVLLRLVRVNLVSMRLLKIVLLKLIILLRVVRVNLVSTRLLKIVLLLKLILLRLVRVRLLILVRVSSRLPNLVRMNLLKL